MAGGRGLGVFVRRGVVRERVVTRPRGRALSRGGAPAELIPKLQHLLLLGLRHRSHISHLPPESLLLLFPMPLRQKVGVLRGDELLLQCITLGLPSSFLPHG